MSIITPVYKEEAMMAALSMFIAGLIHFVVVPGHWEHAPAHGIVFMLIGSMQVWWGIVFWRKPSENLSRLGIIVCGASIVLWALTRIFPAPFEEGPESIGLIDSINKLFELFVIVALFIYTSHRSKEKKVLPSIVRPLIVAIVIGIVTYAFGMIAEQLLPQLKGKEAHHEENVEKVIDMHHDAHDHEHHH